MIILITGASHMGKTLLAQKLPEHYKHHRAACRRHQKPRRGDLVDMGESDT